MCVIPCPPLGILRLSFLGLPVASLPFVELVYLLSPSLPVLTLVSISTFSKLPGCKIRIPTVPSTLAGSASPPKSLSPRPITSNLFYSLESVPDVLLADGALERDAGITRVQSWDGM